LAEKRPFDVLNAALGNGVLVKLKGEIELRGTLASFDVHMNLVLENAEELKDGELKRKLGTVLLRGDTLVFVTPSTG
jgi:small nuclear ribonucleoprotein